MSCVKLHKINVLQYNYGRPLSVSGRPCYILPKLMPMKQRFVLFGYRIYNHNHNHKFNQLTQRVTSGLQL